MEISNTESEEIILTPNEEEDFESEEIFTLQYFGTNAEDCGDVIFNQCVKEFISLLPTTVTSLEECFPDFHSKEELNKCVRQFVKRFYSALEVNSEVLQRYLKNVIFNIPPSTLLPECIVQRKYINEKKKHELSEHKTDQSLMSQLDAQILEAKTSIKETKQENMMRKLHFENLELLENRLISINSKLNDIGEVKEHIGKTFDSVL